MDLCQKQVINGQLSKYELELTAGPGLIAVSVSIKEMILVLICRWSLIPLLPHIFHVHLLDLCM